MCYSFELSREFWYIFYDLLDQCESVRLFYFGKNTQGAAQNHAVQVEIVQ